MPTRKEKHGPAKKASEDAGDRTASGEKGAPAKPTVSLRELVQKGLPKGGPGKPDLKRYRAILLAIREKVLRSSRNLSDEALKASGQDFSVDHMADHGTDNFEQDFSLALLEGETELMRDIESALQKIDGNAELPYGLCETCADVIVSRGADSAPHAWIAKGRLDVIPYARLCVVHQEKQEGSGE